MATPNNLTGRFPRTATVLLRPCVHRTVPNTPGALRRYATQNSLPRKSISVTSDDGRVPWGELRPREKVARSTQQSFNFVVVIAGIVMTSAVGYFLYLEVFSTDSKTSHFNRAVKRIKSDTRCTDLLGDKDHIKAYGEPTWNRWSRNRPIASKHETDRMGIEHLYINFNVEGRQNVGRVNIHMTKRPSETEFEYKYFYVDVKGHERVWLENADANRKDKPSGKIFGIKFF